MRKLNRVKVGQVIKCKYPLHGNRNILCNRLGKVEKVGTSVNGQYVLLAGTDGTYRTLSRNKMIDPVVVS